MTLLGIISVGFDVKNQLLIIFFALVRYCRKNGSTMRQYIRYVFIDFKKAYDSVMREVLYNILTEFEVLVKLVRLIKMCSNETYIKACTDKYLSGAPTIQNGLKQGDALSSLLFSIPLNTTLGRYKKTRRTEIQCDTLTFSLLLMM
jgi:hypothetical protein